MRGVRNNPAVRRSRAAKRDSIAAIEELVESARLVALLGYRGVNGPKAEQVRRTVERLGGRYHVVKNTLARLALGSGELAALAAHCDGPSALLVGEGDPDPLLIGFREFLGGAFKVPRYRKVSPTSVQGKHWGGAYASGHREGAFEIEIRAVAIERRVLAPEELDIVIAAGGLANVRARLLRTLTPPARFLGVLAAPLQQFAAVVSAR